MHLSNRDFGGISSAKDKLGKLKSAIERSNTRQQFFENYTSTKASSSSSSSSSSVAYDANSIYSSPVSAGNGSFLTSINIGTPGVSSSVIVDTGSDLVWRQCLPCQSCYSQKNPIFNPSLSSTYKNASCTDPLCKALVSYECLPTCTYAYLYGDFSSTVGDLAYDTINLRYAYDNRYQSIPNFAFGCGHDNEGLDNFGGAEGILGLGQGPLSLISQLSIPKFSYCLVSIDDAITKTGPLFLGDIPTLSGSQVQSTPIITNTKFKSFYYLGLNGISVGDRLLDIPRSAFELQSDGSGGMIIDSGTTITYLVTKAYKPVLEAFESAINLPKADGSLVGLELCYEGLSQDVVPTLTFHFDGADFNLPTQNYFIHIEGMSCLALASSSGISIFGNIQQQNYHILYDLATSNLFFTPASCDQL